MANIPHADKYKKNDINKEKQTSQCPQYSAVFDSDVGKTGQSKPTAPASFWIGVSVAVGVIFGLLSR
jgi:hypothetical protein